MPCEREVIDITPLNLSMFRADDQVALFQAMSYV